MRSLLCLALGALSCLTAFASAQQIVVNVDVELPEVQPVTIDPKFLEPEPFVLPDPPSMWRGSDVISCTGITRTTVTFRIGPEVQYRPIDSIIGQYNDLPPTTTPIQANGIRVKEEFLVERCA